MNRNLLKLTAIALCSMMALPLSAQKAGSIRIGAHRGFWKCEEAGGAQNSIAALKQAQDCNLWGSEFDVHLTADNEVVVHHDPDIQGVSIQKSDLATIREFKLKNGEVVPTLDEYLTQGEKCAATVLVLEFKKQYSEERENRMVDITLEKLKAHGLYNPERVIFISFSKNICLKIAKDAPEFTNQYLKGEIAPSDLHKMGINGIDYQDKVIYAHPEWVKEAQDLGMSVNVWTVDNEKDIQAMIDLGVDCITTNEPLLTRKLLGSSELRAEAESCGKCNGGCSAGGCSGGCRCR